MSNGKKDMVEDLGKLIQVRMDKVKEIREDFLTNPYPYNYQQTNFSTEIKENFDKYFNEENPVKVSIAGRMMSQRIMGKASFCNIMDKDGKIQCYVARANIGEDSYRLFKKLDIGDIIGITGIVKKTKVGEITVYADSMTLLCKNIRPLPIVKEKEGETFDSFADKELRYRNRHTDLIVNQDVKDLFVKRLQITREIRRILDSKEFYEVETPVLQPIYGGANASPFTTHHNALGMKLYMRIALEPYLKRLIVGGIDRVYEMSKCFRNEGMDATHNPEFTMLELYQAYADYNDMMNITEELFESCALQINNTTKVNIDDKEIELKRPWRRVKMTDYIQEITGMNVLTMSNEEMISAIKKKGEDPKIDENGEFLWGLGIEQIFELYCEETIVQPTFITHQPKETSPLCKVEYDDPRFLQRFELFINGNEYANAYSESNDPIFQRKTLYEQSLRRKVDDEVSPMDENFVQAIETGMPPTGGLGIGIDRMVMLLLQQHSIRDVLLFPTMKPDNQNLNAGKDE